MPTDIKSYKIKYDGGVGKSAAPFRMKAADYNNSPIEKNYGTPAQRGIAAFGTKDGEGQDKISTDSDFSPFSFNSSAAVGSSPAKGWFKKALGGIKNIAKKAVGATTGKINELAGVDTGKVAPHGDEAHTTSAAAGAVDAAANPSAMFGPNANAQLGTGGLGDAASLAMEKQGEITQGNLEGGVGGDAMMAAAG